MNASTNVPSDSSRDPDFVAAEAAMHRAAKVAAKRAESVNRRHDRSETADDGSEHSISRHWVLQNLSFSQAAGYEELPKTLKLEELPWEARLHIWNVFYFHLENSADFVPMIKESYYVLAQEWHNIMRQFYLWHDNVPLDELEINYDLVCRDLKERIYDLSFNKVFDLIQFVIRQPECTDEFSESIGQTFERCRLAYTITKDQPRTIIPAVTEAEGKAIATSLSELSKAGLVGSESHLRKAAERINRSEWADSIRESIHAIESVARQIAPNKTDTLTQALESIDKKASLHPHLKEACKKLYWYTCDEEGVRHALLDRKHSKVGRDEAVFMLGACASFASYLWRKHAEGEGS